MDILLITLIILFLSIGMYSAHLREAAFSLLIDPNEYWKIQLRYLFLWPIASKKFKPEAKSLLFKGLISELSFILVFIIFLVYLWKAN